MRGRRHARADRHRCPVCRMHRSLCLCALLPRLEARTRVVLIRHQLEERKPTNTGRLAELCLASCVVIQRGSGADEAPDQAWSTGTPVLLYPHRDAQPLERFRDATAPLTLIVPDATWRQAAKFRRRVPGLDRVPCAVLPPAGPSAYRLRRAFARDRLSTIEAIARALGLLEDPELERRLDEAFRVMVDRTLWTNGRLPAEEVTGGIPEGARSHDPLSGRPDASRTQ